MTGTHEGRGDHRAHVAALTQLYGCQRPGAQALADALPGLADATHAQLLALYVAPSASSAEQVACSLEDARRHVLQLAEAIRREVPNDGGA
ncbi:MAG: hypothetical protein DI635_01300 [Pseudoxanthomonas suwonensis]|nr:MAG: hypothetical protein DI635_01300 [Pseudoxanthomonas suwonensis]